MLELRLSPKPTCAYRVLCLGSHSDDIEIGCGGTILKMIENFRHATFHWVVFSATQEREREALESARAFLAEARTKHVEVRNFRDAFFPYVGSQIKEYFEQLKDEVSPDLVFTHYRNDLHQDHRLISDLTRNAFRRHLVLEYEVPKYDGDFGSPNLFVPLSESLCRRKTEYILQNFKSQQGKDWFDSETFLSVLRLRGMESRSPSKYAEAFYCRKIVLELIPNLF